MQANTLLFYNEIAAMGYSEHTAPARFLPRGFPNRPEMAAWPSREPEITIRNERRASFSHASLHSAGLCSHGTTRNSSFNPVIRAIRA